MPRWSRSIAACLSLTAACGGETRSPDAAVIDAGRDAALRLPNPTCRAPAQPVREGLQGLPARLADTGCFTTGDPVVRPVPALIAYTVNAPLWSDGADK